VKETKRKLLEFLIQVKRSGKKNRWLRCACKGNTLLNYCSIRTDFIDYTVDRNPHKHGKFLPGTRIPIYPPDQIRRDTARLPTHSSLESQTGNHAAECILFETGRQVVVPIPEVKVYS